MSQYIYITLMPTRLIRGFLVFKTLNTLFKTLVARLQNLLGANKLVARGESDDNLQTSLLYLYMISTINI